MNRLQLQRRRYNSMALFDNDFLKRLEYLSIASRNVFRGQMMAQRRTTQTGSGIEFADHQPYSPGDDFRYLDWNLYARHDELLLKRFQEEEDLHVYLLLDCSGSMSTGIPAKFDLARQVTAALAYVALSDLDRIAVSGFAEKSEHRFPLTRGKGQILRLIRFLESLVADGKQTDLEQVIQQFVQRSPRRGVVIVLSDLFAPSGFQRGLDVLRHHRFEPHVIQIVSDEDLEPGLLGDLEITDAETGETRQMVVTEQHIEKYQKAVLGYLNKVQEYCSEYETGYTLARSGMSYDQLVMEMLRTK